MSEDNPSMSMAFTKQDFIRLQREATDQLHARCAKLESRNEMLCRNIQLARLASEFDKAPDNYGWEDDHPIFQMAADIDRLESEKAQQQELINDLRGGKIKPFPDIPSQEGLESLQRAFRRVCEEKAQQQERMAELMRERDEWHSSWLESYNEARAQESELVAKLNDWYGSKAFMSTDHMVGACMTIEKLEQLMSGEDAQTAAPHPTKDNTHD